MARYMEGPKAPPCPAIPPQLFKTEDGGQHWEMVAGTGGSLRSRRPSPRPRAAAALALALTRRLLAAGHTVAIAEQMTMPRFPSTTPDADAALRSRDRLLQLAEETGAYIVRGHDDAQWSTLPHSPRPFARPASAA